MNSALIPLDNYLSSALGFSHTSYADLSKSSAGVPLVSFALAEAYNFDEVVRMLFVACPSSVDALLLKTDLYFIEFKRTGSSFGGIIKKNLQKKLSESLLIFQKKFEDPLGINSSLFAKKAIIVLNSCASPVASLSAAMSGLSGASTLYTRNNFWYLYEADRNGNHVFYEDVLVWNEINFSANIVRLP